MPIVKAADAPVFYLEKTKFTGLTAPSRGATELSSWFLDLETGAGGAPHYLDHEEVFVGLTGVITISIDGEAFELTPGDAVSVPAGAALGANNFGSETARAVVCLPVGTKATFADGTEFGVPPWAK